MRYGDSPCRNFGCNATDHAFIGSAATPGYNAGRISVISHSIPHTLTTMPGRPLLLFVALFTVLGAVLYPKVMVFGLFRSPISLNNEDCVTIPGLEACEEGWVDRRLGLAYLACSDIPSRGAWVPSMDRYNASALPDISTDYIALLSLTPPYKYRALKITGHPKEAHGIWTHGMRVWQDPSDPAALTLFLVSHRPPVNRASAPKVGADSVVEIFRTRAGEDEVQWVRTVKHNLIRTPNTVVPVGPMSFYVSNDHAKKTQWMRELNVLYTTSSEIIYCDASTRNSDCKVAADGIIYPNGMAVVSLSPGAGQAISLYPSRLYSRGQRTVLSIMLQRIEAVCRSGNAMLTTLSV
ncbi:hypothetical protein FRB95_007650 [Tulasnella sp. JGI-2019a]|nr:hypothetical protein FRB95_007650 [Tulasnella sp. JGI-2019a]